MRTIAIALLVLLAGCHKSFDERYADAQAKIGEQAASIDKELAEKASAAPPAPTETMPATGVAAAPSPSR